LIQGDRPDIDHRLESEERTTGMPQILVLDDNALISVLLEDWLMELGCEVAGPVPTVADALRLIEETGIDAAFLDLSVSDGDCMPVAAALDKRRVPFTFATGGGIDGAESRFPNAGVMIKPYDFEDVKNALDRMLGKPAVSEPT
jgi:CheY-like chemotaxis protein